MDRRTLARPAAQNLALSAVAGHFFENSCKCLYGSGLRRSFNHRGTAPAEAWPRQQEVIERILRHCGVWEGPLRTLANPQASPRGSPGKAAGESNEPRELELVLDQDFVQDQVHEATAESAHELQLVLDPEFL